MSGAGSSVRSIQDLRMEWQICAIPILPIVLLKIYDSHYDSMTVCADHCLDNSYVEKQQAWKNILCATVPKSRSSVKVKYQGHSFRKNGRCVDISISQTLPV